MAPSVYDEIRSGTTNNRRDGAVVTSIINWTTITSDPLILLPSQIFKLPTPMATASLHQCGGFKEDVPVGSSLLTSARDRLESANDVFPGGTCDPMQWGRTRSEGMIAMYGSCNGGMTALNQSGSTSQKKAVSTRQSDNLKPLYVLLIKSYYACPWDEYSRWQLEQEVDQVTCLGIGLWLCQKRQKNLHSIRSEEGQIKRKIIGVGKGRAKAAKNPDRKEPGEVVYSIEAQISQEQQLEDDGENAAISIQVTRPQKISDRKTRHTCGVRKVYRHAEMVGPYAYPFVLFSAAGRGARLTLVHRAQLGGPVNGGDE
ncbi:hypothetical protein F5146DRAFT_1182636 [Armillaria mellea]|nr:hypothetical protein F5146DRAFT_1182636 [Armillaria mellea]